MTKGKVVFITWLMVIGYCHGAFKLDERYSWNQLDFVFPTQQMKDLALASGTYIPQNALPVGIEHWGNRLFVTVPRWMDGENYFSLFSNFLGKILEKCVVFFIEISSRSKKRMLQTTFQFR